MTIGDDDDPPGPPQDLAADPDDGEVTLSWLPPAGGGSAEITGYEYRYAEDSDAYPDSWMEVSGGDAAREVTVGGLRNGTLHRFQVRAVNDVGGGDPAETTATPAVPSVLEIGDVTVGEGDGTAVLEVTLTPASTETVTVDYAMVDVTATAGEDYTAASGSLTFAPGETSMEISLSITDDPAEEDDETFTVTLSDAVNGSIGGASGQVTITDDDEAPGPPQELMADKGDGEVALSWLPPASSGTSAITGYEYRYAEDTDAFPDSWTGIAGGAAAREVTVGNLANGTLHRFQVRAVSLAGGGEPAEIPATPTPAPSLTIGDVTVDEGAGTAVVQVTLAPTDEETVTVEYATSNESATAGEDYTPATGTLTFAGGETSQEISIPIMDDSADEDDETLTVTLRDPVNAVMGDRTGEVTITDNDDLPGAPEELEAEVGDTEVTLSWTPPVDVGSADISGYQYRYAADADAFPDLWTGVSGGDAAREVTVGNLTNGRPYRFQVRAVNPVGGGDPAEVPATPAATATLTISDATAGEGDGTVVLKVTLGPSSTEEVTVDYATVNGTAAAGSDYAAANGSLTYAAGVTSQEIRIAILDDNADESTETFAVTLSNVTSALIGDSTGQVTVTDDDRRPSAPQALVAEPGDEEAGFSWSPPASGGSAPITRYEYRYAAGTDAFADSWTTAAGGAAAREVALANLVNGTVYRFEVRAANTVGPGAAAETTAAPTTTKSLSIGDVAVDEDDGTAALRVTLSPASTKTVTVAYATANGTATAGEDYTAANGTLTFAPGTTTRDISVEILDDDIEESDETFFVTLSNARHALLTDVRGRATIRENDPPEVNPPGAPEDLLAHPGDGRVALSWRPPASDGGAEITGYEYRFAMAGGTLPGAWTGVPGGTGAREVTVHNLANGTTYRFQVRARNSAGPGPPAQTTATPEEPPPTPGVSVRPRRLQITEGGSGDYSVALLTQPSATVTVRMTADLAGTGLTVRPAWVFFTTSNWNVPQRITVESAVDPDEDDQLGIELTHVASGGGYDGVAVPTVVVDVRDPGLPTIEGDDASAGEGPGGRVVFNVRLSAASNATVRVDYATLDGTAVAGADYVERTGTLVFPPGTTNLAIPVRVVHDLELEGDEVFHLSLSNPVNAKLGAVGDRLVLAGTIVDDEEYTRVSFGAGTYEVDEGGNVSVTVVLSGDPGRNIQVPISVSRGRGVKDDEFTVARSVSFNRGQTQTGLSFGTSEDGVDEDDEVVVLTLGPSFPDGIVAGNPTVTEVVITDDDERGVEVSTEALELQEGGSVNYTVRLTSQPTGNVTVAVEGDLAGSDVTVGPTTLTFTPQSWRAERTVVVKAAEDDDAIEDAVVTLHHRASGADYAGQPAASVSVTVIEDDTPVLSIADASASEDEGQMLFEARLDIPSSREVSVQYNTVGGTATEGVDYEGREGVLVFAPLQTIARVLVPLIDDAIDEAVETFELEVANFENANSAGGPVTGTILDDDVPTLRINAEGETLSEGADARFQLVREGDLGVPLSVQLTVSETGDFLAGTPPEEVQFAIGSAEAILVVPTADDALDELDGTIEVTLARSDDYQITGPATARLTVTDNDAAPAVIITGAQASERTGEIVFPVTLRGASAYEVTVNWVTGDQTARAGADYTTGAGRVTFAPGEISGTIRVAVLDDLLPEPAETFTVTLSGPTNAVLEVGSGIGTITDDDEAVIKGWLSRFGRTVASQVVEGISGRLTGGGAGTHLNTAGTAAGADGDGRGPTLQDLMDGSGFRLSRRSDGQLGDRFSGGVWTAWGQGVRTGFDGADVDLNVDGRVLTAMAGVDYEVGRYLAGVAVARSAGAGTLNMLASGAARERTEEVESGVTGVYPYLRVNVTERVFAWGVLGHGRGDMVFPSIGRPSETDIRLNMGAFGARGVLLDPGLRRVGLALKSDVFMVGMKTEAHLGAIPVAARANRMRLLLEASERRELRAGAILVSTAEMGLRLDGGDADAGAGVEVGAGSRYVNEAYGLSAEGTIRWLMVHSATGFSEWGVGASVLYEPAGAERGLSVRLGSSWGMSAGSAADLWSPYADAKTGAGGGSGAGVGNGNAGALAAQVRYALSPSGRRWSMAPYARVGLAGETRGPTTRVGWRVTLMESLRLSLETGWGGVYDDEGKGITLRGSLRR